MPPTIATLLTVVFILVLFRREFHLEDKVSGALWLPVFWISICGSRFVGQWINLGSSGGVDDGTQGSLIDSIYFLTLILWGIRILAIRSIAFKELLRKNLWLTAFFIYCFIAISWSDFPIIAFKRFIKILGHPVMALIILTDPDPITAFRIVMKRISYLLMPLSVLFIKYYPQYGRGFDAWSGEGVNTGIHLSKSELGGACMLFGIFFFWNLLMSLRIEDRRIKIEEFCLSLGFFCMIMWLLRMAHSSTSLVTFLIGVVTMGMLGLRMVNKRFIGTYVIVAAIVVVAAELIFGMSGKIIELLGEDPTLTDRTKVWADCIALVDNPFLGAGFESFWLGSRLEILWAKWWWRPNQAHNGYIETYLNLGFLGVFLLVGVIVSAFRKITIDLLTNFDFARLRLGFLFAIIFYNYTEASFKGVSIIWTIFSIIAINYPKPTRYQMEKTVAVTTRPVSYHRYVKGRKL